MRPWTYHCPSEPQFPPFAKLISKHSLGSESPAVFATDNFPISLSSLDLLTNPVDHTAFCKISLGFQLRMSETKLLSSLYFPKPAPPTASPISANRNSIHLIAWVRISVTMLQFLSLTPYLQSISRCFQLYFQNISKSRPLLNTLPRTTLFCAAIISCLVSAIYSWMGNLPLPPGSHLIFREEPVKTKSGHVPLLNTPFHWLPGLFSIKGKALTGLRLSPVGGNRGRLCPPPNTPGL